MAKATIASIADIRKFILERRATFPVTQFIPQSYDSEGNLIIPSSLPAEDASTIYSAPAGDDVALANAIISHVDWPTVAKAEWAGLMAFDIALATSHVLAYKVVTKIKTWCEANLDNPNAELEELANRTIVYVLTLIAGNTINVGDPAYSFMITKLAAVPTNIEQTTFVLTETEKNAMLQLCKPEEKQTLSTADLFLALGRN